MNTHGVEPETTETHTSHSSNSSTEHEVNAHGFRAPPKPDRDVVTESQAKHVQVGREQSSVDLKQLVLPQQKEQNRNEKTRGNKSKSPLRNDRKVEESEKFVVHTSFKGNFWRRREREDNQPGRMSNDKTNSALRSTIKAQAQQSSNVQQRPLFKEQKSSQSKRKHNMFAYWTQNERVTSRNTNGSYLQNEEMGSDRRDEDTSSVMLKPKLDLGRLDPSARQTAKKRYRSFETQEDKASNTGTKPSPLMPAKKEQAESEGLRLDSIIIEEQGNMEDQGGNRAKPQRMFRRKTQKQQETQLADVESCPVPDVKGAKTDSDVRETGKPSKKDDKETGSLAETNMGKLKLLLNKLTRKLVKSGTLLL